MENKVTYGLENVHYAVMTIAGDKVTYAKPKAIKGAVELSIEPKGDIKEFEADNSVYYAVSENQGYEGSLTIAKLPESFLTEVLGEKKDSDGTISESVDAKMNQFALLFQFEGDQTATRHVLYSCTANRPTVGSKTGKEVNTTELSFKATGKPKENINESQIIKRRTTDTTTPAVYNAWFNAVYLGASTVAGA